MVGLLLLVRSEPIVNQHPVDAKKIFITTESHEVFVLRTGTSEWAFGNCRDCGSEVQILTLDGAISLSGIRTGELVRLAETNEIHSIETSTGHLLICKKSLEKTCRERREHALPETSEEH
jgi:hypothetical protein